MAPIVIVGTGLGGYTVAREFRRIDQDTPLILVTADGGQFYSKPMLSNAFASGKTPETLPNATVAQMAKQLHADIRVRARITSIDPAANTVMVDGEMLAYAKLVLAIGADPIRLSLNGDAADAVVSVNNLDDYACFRSQLAGRERVAIMGAGLIGCEFANDLLSAGYSVEVIDPVTWPLGRLLPSEAGEAMQRALAGVGVRWHLGQTVVRASRTKDDFQLELSNGTRLSTDVVLSAVGLRPRHDLAFRSGIAVNRGIVVDRSLRTSEDNVYALGDCAEVEGFVLPFVMPIMHAGRALAKTLAGDPTFVTYPAMPVVVKTPAWPTVISPPPMGLEGAWEVNATESGVLASFREGNGALRGFAVSGDRIPEKNTLTRELPPLLA